LYRERLALRVRERGRTKEYVSVAESKCFSPEEFRSLVESSGIFTFLGFFRHLSRRPLMALENDNFVLIQKTQES